jgi:hypothetical protein
VGRQTQIEEHYSFKGLLSFVCLGPEGEKVSSLFNLVGKQLSKNVSNQHVGSVTTTEHPLSEMLGLECFRFWNICLHTMRHLRDATQAETQNSFVSHVPYTH